MNFDKSKLTSIKGDASFRRFYRRKLNKKNSIIVYSKVDKNKNLLIYDAVNKILYKNKIYAPQLISENYKKNFIEIEDLGKQTVFNILKKKNNKLKIYRKILLILLGLQNIKIKKIRNFKNKIYKIPYYSKKILFNEVSLFLNWYIPQHISKKKITFVKKELKKSILNLIKKIQLPNKTFVHRDFHVSNLMMKNNKVAIIDSQDAVYGNIAYDLASLIDDVRLKSSKNHKESIYQNYLKLNKKKINKIKFKNDFEILSVLRNLKIIGIFTRLAKRDKKKKYLKLIPYAWKLIEDRIDNNKVFIELKKKLENNFIIKIKKKNDS